MRNIIRIGLATAIAWTAMHMTAQAQDPLDALDLDSTEMSQAEMSRQDVVDILNAATGTGF